jgi:two-component system, chemotaxis family, protein-glutamate methylesterase/glutaminase
VSETASASAELRDVDAIVIGASAGAITALLHLLPSLPAEFPRPIIVVVHVAPQHSSSLGELLQPRCRVTVKEAEDKEEMKPGTVYVAPPDYHLLVEKDRRLSLSTEEPVNFSRPSIDVLFESAVDVYGGRLLAIILTGANNDGAQGVHAVCEAGGRAWVQTPASAQARSMPEAALAACPHAESMTLDTMSERLSSTR